MTARSPRSGKSQAVIEFNLDGTIVTANDELPRRASATRSPRSRASITACSSIRTSATRRAYREFWDKLNRGEYQAAEYKRIAKGGREIWIQASYNPILDLNGKPFKVVKYATDVTVQAVLRRKAENARSLIETGGGGQRGDERFDPRNFRRR